MTVMIDQAIALRKQGDFDQAITLLQKAAQASNDFGRAMLHIAWCHDTKGEEREAIPFYKKALEGRLPKEERFDCLLGLASSLRCLGRYEEADIFFRIAKNEYPDNEELLPFYAMNLYNLGRSDEAVTILLKLLVSSTDSEDIKAYKEAIELYASDLNKAW